MAGLTKQRVTRALAQPGAGGLAGMPGGLLGCDRAVSMVNDVAGLLGGMLNKR